MAGQYTERRRAILSDQSWRLVSAQLRLGQNFTYLKRFRLADCQLDVLRKCLRVNNIKNVLDTLPNSLFEIYDRILARIDEAYDEDASVILKWLAFSARPVSSLMSELF